MRRTATARLRATVALVGLFCLADRTLSQPRLDAPEMPFLTGVNLASGTFGPEIRPGGPRGRHGREYVYPSATFNGGRSSAPYFLSKGMNSFRVGFLWERVQPRLGAPLDPDDLDRLDRAVTELLEAGGWVILDIHNYARYEQRLIGSPDVPIAAFSDLWRRLAEHFANQSRLIFNIMNEPYGIRAETWAAAANQAVAAIRETGARNLVLVPGINYSSTRHWLEDGNSETLLTVRDPLNRMAFDGHIYLNRTATGQEPDCVSADIGVERLAPFVAWLRRTGQQGFLGEFGGGPGKTCLDALARMTRYMDQNRDVFIGWSYWAAGPWWPKDYFTSIEPREDGSDAPQMQTLQPYLSLRADGKATR